ncbi:HAD-IA family hydrolase [Aurantimonas sp. MSK8Z-1]|uniref:HAD-IA family hydrolase n=1 Tax=Mangrovibrevibacter kandeliae TaxID=2968473 RepID=UPI00211796C4|nr:HAD-IA family hydrolase [Aurantimonas sp. MSK8Z-1]MCW4114801.1 HAD-IA family hydrolase [Aurantimonas sp. MSK8Z-1]
MRLILFDCDGTLADTCGLICETMRRTFVTKGLAAPADAATRAIIGLSLDEAMRRLHPPATPELILALAEQYRTHFRAARADPSFAETLFPGIPELLAELRVREDVLLGIVTGKSRRGVASIVETHALDGHFITVRTADDCPSKPHPAMVLESCAECGVDPDQTVVVGDAIYDMQMARAAGAEAIGVGWGTTPAEALQAAGAGAVAADTAELARLLEIWMGVPGEPQARPVEG